MLIRFRIQEYERENVYLNNIPKTVGRPQSSFFGTRDVQIEKRVAEGGMT
jgi:hypothetical protein